MVANIPKMVILKVGACKSKQNNPTIEPIRLDLKRSIDNLLESFPSGEITNIILIKVHISSYSGNRIYNSYPIKNPKTQRVA